MQEISEATGKFVTRTVDGWLWMAIANNAITQQQYDLAIRMNRHAQMYEQVGAKYNACDLEQAKPLATYDWQQ